MPILKAEHVEAAMLKGGPANVDADVAASFVRIALGFRI